ncbi:MAG: ADP compounds hydrolase NudE [Algicola sp.]|nr:ADP compounds hydrolase NudE [Algicola sp.]
MRQKKLPEIVASEVVAQSRLFTVEGLHLKFTNGVERQYERMKGSSRGAVMIIPMLDADTMLLISEYSAGTHRYELGFPKGLIDPGETPEQAANRELMEEVGYGANKLVKLKEVTLAPGYFNAQMTILLAFDLFEQSLEGDEPEPLEVIPWSLSRSDELLDNPEFSESRSVAGLLLAQKWFATHG